MATIKSPSSKTPANSSAKTPSRSPSTKPASTLEKISDAVGDKVDKVEVALGLKTAKNKTTNEADDSRLHQFFVEELKDIYWAEKQIAKTLPKMAKAATSTKLKAAFETHQAQTETHITRLEQVFESLGEKAKTQKCEAMNGILEEGNTIISDTEKGTATRDVGLILAAQKVEHYEIATYGGLAQLAKTLGRTKAATLLSKTLQEEKDTDSLLTTIAENNVNYNSAREAA